MGKCEVCDRPVDCMAWLRDEPVCGGAMDPEALAECYRLGYERAIAELAIWRDEDAREAKYENVSKRCTAAEEALAAANARADEWQALANTNAASLTVLTEALAAANARADAAEADAKHARGVLATCAREEKAHRDALAAARRECEGLRKLLSDARPWVHQLYRMQDCHSETAPEATKILRTLKRIDAALAAPADGEEG